MTIAYPTLENKFAEILVRFKKRLYLCSVKNQEGHEAAAPETRLLILCPCHRDITSAATAWGHGNTPKGLPSWCLDSA